MVSNREQWDSDIQAIRERSELDRQLWRIQIQHVPGQRQLRVARFEGRFNATKAKCFLLLAFSQMAHESENGSALDSWLGLVICHTIH